MRKLVVLACVVLLSGMFTACAKPPPRPNMTFVDGISDVARNDREVKLPRADITRVDIATTNRVYVTVTTRLPAGERFGRDFTVHALLDTPGGRKFLHGNASECTSSFGRCQFSAIRNRVTVSAPASGIKVRAASVQTITPFGGDEAHIERIRSRTLDSTPFAHSATVDKNALLVSESTMQNTGFGEFQVPCSPSHMSTDDPIVYPGQPGAAHLHTFAGNASVNAFTNAVSIAKDGASSCYGGELDRSGYWWPAMIMPDGSARYPDTIIAYYKSFSRNVRPFPLGLRMATPRTPGKPIPYTSGRGVGVSEAGMRCYRTPGSFMGTVPSCPKVSGQQVNGLVRFPSCWDGRNLDSPDHISHMFFVNDFDSNCPASHPVALPRLEIAIYWNVPNAGTGGWRLSSDMGAARGSSLHADFFNGWDPAIQKTAVDNCLNRLLVCKNSGLGNGKGLRFRTLFDPIPKSGIPDSDDVPGGQTRGDHLVAARDHPPSRMPMSDLHGHHSGGG